MLTKIIGVPFFLLFLTVSSWSATYQLDFTSSNFYNGFLPSNDMRVASPISTTPISGSFVYEAESMYSGMKNLYSIDLTINGYSYNINDVGYIHYENTWVVGRDNSRVGDTASSLSVGYNVNDFWLYGKTFAYTASDGVFYYNNHQMDSYSILEVATPGLAPKPSPEPQSYALLTGFSDKGTLEIRQYLIEAGWDKNNIFVLPENIGLSSDVLSEFVAKTGISENDEFLFYYKGHGGIYQPDLTDPNFEYVPERQGETHEEGLFEEHFSVYDYASDEAIIYGEENNKSVIFDDELTQMFNTEEWNSISKTFILDACFSGGFIGGNDTDGLGDLDILPHTTLIYSTPEDKTTPASWSIGGDKTILTNYILLEGLRELQADSLEGEGADGFVTIKELFDWWDNYGSKEGTIFEKIKLATWDTFLDAEYPIGPLPDDFDIMDYINLAGYYTNEDEDYLSSKAFLAPLNSAPAPVPEPSTFLLLGSSLVVLGFYARKRKTV